MIGLSGLITPSLEEMAGVALFLASPLAGFVTGQTIVADGGVTLITQDMLDRRAAALS